MASDERRLEFREATESDREYARRVHHLAYREIVERQFGEWDEAARQSVNWLFPLIKQQNSGFPDADQLYDMPFALIPQAPYLARRDHFEKAGIEKNDLHPPRLRAENFSIVNAGGSATF